MYICIYMYSLRCMHAHAGTWICSDAVRSRAAFSLRRLIQSNAKYVSGKSSSGFEPIAASTQRRLFAVCAASYFQSLLRKSSVYHHKQCLLRVVRQCTWIAYAVQWSLFAVCAALCFRGLLRKCGVYHQKHRFAAIGTYNQALSSKICSTAGRKYAEYAEKWSHTCVHTSGVASRT